MAERTMETNTGREIADEARATAEQTKQRMAEQLDERKGSVAREVHGLARALRTTADECERQEQGSSIAGYARRAADGVERVGDAIERKSLSEMLSDLERVSRERPLLVGTAAVIAGLLGARIARTATQSRREQLSLEDEYQPHEPSPVDVMRSEGGI